MTSCPEAMGWNFFSSAGELTVGDVGTVSIIKIVSLSPRVEKLKVKKVNKRFVPELKEVVSVSGFLCM